MRGSSALAWLWLVTRAGVIILLLTWERSVLGDVDYYARSLDGLADRGLADVLIEYPVPGVVLVALPWLVTELFGRPDYYATVLVAFALATDGAFLGLLRRAGRWGRPGTAWWGVSLGEWAWLLAVPLLGATAYARFDLLPGILCGCAILYSAHRPGVATALAAVATGLKYWPAPFLAALAVSRVARLRAIAVTAAVGGLLALGSASLAGWWRLVSPLVWQSDRGLQIESVAATPAMIGFAADPETFTTVFTEHNAFEVFGPSVAGLLTVGEIATAVLVLVLGWHWWRSWQVLSDRSRDGVDVVVWLCLAATTGYIVTSKVFSPQYLLWILPSAVAGLVVLRGDDSWRRLLRWTVLLLAATALTQLVFPLAYGPLIDHRPLTGAVVALLTVRNALMVWLAVVAFAEVRRCLARAATSAPQRSVVTGGAERPHAR